MIWLPGLFGSAVMQAQVPADSAKPNVLFIIVDDLSDYVGYLSGHPQTITPFIDRLADKGVAFTNAHCNAPQCSPSRLSMLSGKLPAYTGVYQAGQANDGDIRSNFGGQPVWTLPEILKDSGGYYTAVASKVFHGKSHAPPISDIDYDSVGTDDCARAKSWSTWLDFPRQTQEPDSNKRFGFGQYEWGQIDDGNETKMQDYRGVSAALSFLTDYTNDPSAYCNRPFFLAVGIFRPHSPFFSPEKYWSEFYQPDPYQLPYRIPYNQPDNAFPPNGIVLGARPDAIPSDYENLPFIGKVNANQHMKAPDKSFTEYPGTLIPSPIVEPGMDSELKQNILQESFKANSMMGYLSSVRFADAMVGRLLDALDAQPEVRDNTIIVLVSDHGYAMGEKRHWGKVGLWDQITRVPMIIVDPRRPGGKLQAQPSTLVDVFPTILELTGTPAPKLTDGSEYLDGQSLVPVLDNPGATLPKPAITAVGLSGSYPDGNCFPHYAVNDGRWRYIRYLTNNATDSSASCSIGAARFQEELYEIGINRDVDPNEFNNLANEPQYRGIMDYLAQYIPPSPSFNQPISRAKIQFDSLPCTINLKDTTVFRASYTAPDGTFYDGTAPGVIYRWYSSAMPIVQSGNEAFILRDVLDSSEVAGLELLPLHLQAIDTVNNTFAEDLLELRIKNDLEPTALLDIQFVAPRTISVQPTAESGLADRVVWDFGDGFLSEDRLPPPHAYAAPGTYQLRFAQFYGNDPSYQCSELEDAMVTISASDFAGSPCLPLDGVNIKDIASNKAKASWNPGYQAVGFRLRIKPGEDPFAPWKYSGGTGTQTNLTKLGPNRAYEVQVKAYCSGLATDSSDWSYPVRFRTPPCYNPIGIALDSVGTDQVTIRWTGQNENQRAHEVFVRRLAGGGILRRTVIDNYQTTFTGLDPGTAYQYRLRTYCVDANGDPTVKGPFSEIYDFNTLDTSGLRLAVSPGLLAPNPASQQLTLQQLGTDVSVRVINPSGQVVLRQESVSGSLQIDVSQWPSGLYMVEWHEPESAWQRESVVVQH